MSRYRAETITQEGETLYVLRDGHTGASARVWPGFGNNCLSATLPAPGGRLVDLLLAPGDLGALRAQPSWWGIPLLFPWPGRIPRGEYVFQGQRYRLPTLDMNGNAGHGFAKTRPWKVERFQAWESAAFLRCSLSSADHPETLEGYPFPYYLAATYRLDNDGLHLIAEVMNVGQGPLPFGFGAHPYFQIPFGPEGSPGGCLITVPAARRWDLARVAAPAAGEPLAWEDVTVPVTAETDLRTPRPLAGRHFDGGYTDLDLGTGRLECRVIDPQTGLEGVMQASRHFSTVVVYTPPGRPGVCLEPWTCPPNVFNLAASGVEPSGLIILQPGQRWEGSMRLFLRSAR